MEKRLERMPAAAQASSHSDQQERPACMTRIQMPGAAPTDRD